jgi:hypothetical protein
MLIQAEQFLPAVEFGKGRMHEPDCVAAQAMGARDAGLIQGRQRLVSSFHQGEDQELLPWDIPEERRAFNDRFGTRSEIAEPISVVSLAGHGVEQALVERAGNVFDSQPARVPPREEIAMAYAWTRWK